MKELKQLYNDGGNIMSFFRGEGSKNALNSILYSYDLQSGSYTKTYKDGINSDKKNAAIVNGLQVEITDKEYYKLYGKYIAEILDGLKIKNFVEAGVGEATSACNILKYMKTKLDFCGGFDISLSRVMYADKFAKENSSDIKLTVGDLFHMPFADSSIECVVTIHAIEPNTGREEEALKELYRVVSRYAVMFEPDYELGNDATKANIEKNAYIRNLAGTAEKLGMKIIKHELCKVMGVKNNRSVIIIEKNTPPRKKSQNLTKPSPALPAGKNRFFINPTFSAKIAG